MAVHITKRDAHHAVQRLQSIQRRIASIKERAEETTERIVTTAETAGAAFAMGVVQGRTGGVELFGVPLELGLGIGLNAFALLGGAGKHSGHLAAVGTGCLAAYATTLGRGVGATWRDKERGLSGAAAKGLGARVAGVGLSPAEMAMAGVPLAG